MTIVNMVGGGGDVEYTTVDDSWRLSFPYNYTAVSLGYSSRGTTYQFTQPPGVKLNTKYIPGIVTKVNSSSPLYPVATTTTNGYKTRDLSYVEWDDAVSKGLASINKKKYTSVPDTVAKLKSFGFEVGDVLNIVISAIPDSVHNYGTATFSYRQISTGTLTINSDDSYTLTNTGPSSTGSGMGGVALPGTNYATYLRLNMFISSISFSKIR